MTLEIYLSCILKCISKILKCFRTGACHSLLAKKNFSYANQSATVESVLSSFIRICQKICVKFTMSVNELCDKKCIAKSSTAIL